MFQFVEQIDDVKHLRQVENETQFWDVVIQEFGPDYLECQIWPGFLDISFCGDYSKPLSVKTIRCGSNPKNHAVSLTKDQIAVLMGEDPTLRAKEVIQ